MTICFFSFFCVQVFFLFLYSGQSARVLVGKTLHFKVYSFLFDSAD